jgi:hypothetical protein
MMPVVRAAPPLVLLALALPAIPIPAWAQDPFEIQVYDSETAPRGSPGLELHVNNVVQGPREPPPGGPPSEHVTRITFEPHVGVARWAELGGYLQTAVRPDGGYDFAGVKLRFKARLPFRVARLLGFALNGELSYLPRAWSDARFGGELRPIVDLRVGPLYVSLNPILSFDFEGPLAGRPQLEPAAKLALFVAGDVLSVGAEYYGGIGPFYAPFAASQQEHRLFGVFDLDVPGRYVDFTINAGAGWGLAAGERWIVKTILGFAYH